MIESHSVRRFCERQPEGPLPELEDSVAEAARLATRAVDDQAAYIAFRDNDSRFHRSIVALAELPRLVSLYDDLHLSIHVTRAGMEAPITHTRLDTAVDEHRAIIDALEAGDADLARERLESHILRVRDQTIVFLTQPRMNLGRR
jgi:DNA-binding GntR family transcriptional regulator